VIGQRGGVRGDVGIWQRGCRLQQVYERYCNRKGSSGKSETVLDLGSVDSGLARDW